MGVWKVYSDVKWNFRNISPNSAAHRFFFLKFHRRRSVPAQPTWAFPRVMSKPTFPWFSQCLNYRRLCLRCETNHCLRFWKLIGNIKDVPWKMHFYVDVLDAFIQFIFMGTRFSYIKMRLACDVKQTFSTTFRISLIASHPARLGSSGELIFIHFFLCCRVVKIFLVTVIPLI